VTVIKESMEANGIIISGADDVIFTKKRSVSINSSSLKNKSENKKSAEPSTIEQIVPISDINFSTEKRKGKYNYSYDSDDDDEADDDNDEEEDDAEEEDSDEGEDIEFEDEIDSQESYDIDVIDKFERRSSIF
jgi:hypothetical protein